MGHDREASASESNSGVPTCYDALKMFELGKLSSGKAAELAELRRAAFFDGVKVVNGAVHEAGIGREPGNGG